MLKVIITSLVILTLGCSTKNSQHLQGYNFNYKIDKPENNDLIQIFDDGEKTYLHIFELSNKKEPSVTALKIGEDSPKRKYYKIVNSYIVLDGLFKEVDVNSNGKVTKISQDENQK